MLKFLIGGSPCTKWSVAQSKNREKKPEGIGWELFMNYKIAKEQFKPDFFLYENNKSTAQPIKEQIYIELGGTMQHINSALVSAQNRQRFYVHNFGDVPMPEDRGILIQDILENGESWIEKSYALTTRCSGATLKDTLKRHRHTMIAIPVLNSNIKPIRVCKFNKGSQGERIYSVQGKSICLSANGGGLGAKTGLYTLPVNPTTSDKSQCLRATYYKDGMRNMVGNNVDKRTCVAIPVDNPCGAAKQVVGRKANEQGEYERTFELRDDKKANCITNTMSRNMVCEKADYSIFNKPIYEVKNSLIEIKGKHFPIRLPDGFYIIRKLTVTECCRLQTMPDDYCRVVSDSQAYRGLGNGWTAEVIIHLLSHALKGVPKDEKIVVLSMYDGIGTGRYCFDKLGYKNITYYAYEIDKFAMQIALSNYPDIIECGDAFDVRQKDWIKILAR